MRFFAPLRMTVLKSLIIKCTNVLHSGLENHNKFERRHKNLFLLVGHRNIGQESVNCQVLDSSSLKTLVPCQSGEELPIFCYVRSYSRSAVCRVSSRIFTCSFVFMSNT